MPTNLDISSGFLEANTTFIAGHARLYAGKDLPGAHVPYTQKVSTDTVRVQKSWLANIAVPRKFRGARVEKAPRSYAQVMTIAPHEATIALERYDVDYDKTGTVASMLMRFLNQSQTGHSINVNENWVANSGAGLTGADGVALYSAAHPQGPVGATTQSNLAASTAFSYSSVEIGRYTMAEWKLENGEPVRAKMTHIEVGERNGTKARELFGTDRIVAVAADGLEAGTRVAAGVRSNGLAGAVQIIVNERLNTSTLAGYVTLLDLSDPEALPMVLLEAKPLTPQSYDQMSDPRAFKENKYIFGLTGDYDSFAGTWMSCYRMTA